MKKVSRFALLFVLFAFLLSPGTAHAALGWTSESLTNKNDFASEPAPVLWGTGQMMVLARTASNAMWQRNFNGTNWGSFYSLGGSISSSPAPTAWGSALENVSVFARGTSNDLQRRTYNYPGGWSDWVSMGTPASTVAIATEPTATTWGSNNQNVTVFARGNDNDLYKRTYAGSTSTWGGWSTLDQPSAAVLAGVPSAVTWGATSGNITVVSRGSDSALYKRTYSGSNGWNAWASLGGTLASNPKAISCSSGRIDIAARFTDNTIRHMYYPEADGSWSAWRSLGGSFTSDPALTCQGTDIVKVFGRNSSDDRLYRKSLNFVAGTAWQASWYALEAELAASPRAVSLSTSRIDVFSRYTDNKIWDNWYGENTLPAPPASVSLVTAPYTCSGLVGCTVGVTINWPSVSGATGYQLTKQTCSGSAGAETCSDVTVGWPITGVTTQSYTVNQAETEKTKYCVASVDSVGASARTCSSMLALISPPPAPASVSLTTPPYACSGLPGCTVDVAINWPDVSTAREYTLTKLTCTGTTGAETCTDVTGGWPITTSGTLLLNGSRSHTVNQAETEKTKYCVASKNSAGESARSCSSMLNLVVTPPPPNTPPAPSSVTIQKLGDYPTHDHLAHEVEIIWPTVTQAVNHWVRKYRCNSDGSGCVEEVNSYALLPRKVLGGGGSYTQAGGSEIPAGQSAKFCVNSIDSSGRESAYTCSTIYSVPAAAEPALASFTVDYTDPNETEDTNSNSTSFGVTLKWDYLSPSMVYGLEDFLIRKWICSDDANGHRTCDEVVNDPDDNEWPLALPFAAADYVNPGIPGQSPYLQWPTSQRKNGQAVYCIVPRTEVGGTFFEYGSYRCTTNLFPATPY